MGRLLANGRVPIFAVTAKNGSEPAVEFLEALTQAERDRMVRLFEKLANLPPGRFLAKDDFRPIRGKIYEFKDHRRRMMCFSTPEGWFVTHGFDKRTNAATPEREIERAERLLQEHHIAVAVPETSTSAPNKARPQKRKR